MHRKWEEHLRARDLDQGPAVVDFRSSLTWWKCSGNDDVHVCARAVVRMRTGRLSVTRQSYMHSGCSGLYRPTGTSISSMLLTFPTDFEDTCLLCTLYIPIYTGVTKFLIQDRVCLRKKYEHLYSPGMVGEIKEEKIGTASNKYQHKF